MVAAPQSPAKLPLSLHEALDGAQANALPMRMRSCPSAGKKGEVQSPGQVNDGQAHAANNNNSNNNNPSRKGFTPYHSKSVPKSANLQAGVQDIVGELEKPITTMMLRNIPNRYSQNALMEEIDDCGFRNQYNFFYLPMDVHNRSNVGYAFINFLHPDDAKRFGDLFSAHRFEKIHSRKVSSACTAHVQGLDENLKHFENRAVTHFRNDQYRPVVLQNGERLDLETAVADAKARLAMKERCRGSSQSTASSSGGDSDSGFHYPVDSSAWQSPPPGLGANAAAAAEALAQLRAQAWAMRRAKELEEDEAEEVPPGFGPFSESGFGLQLQRMMAMQQWQQQQRACLESMSATTLGAAAEDSCLPANEPWSVTPSATLTLESMPAPEYIRLLEEKRLINYPMAARRPLSSEYPQVLGAGLRGLTGV